MNKMLSTATSMASYHNKSSSSSSSSTTTTSSSSSSSTPTRTMSSRNRDQNTGIGRFGFTYNNNDNDNDIIYMTGDIIGTDYFVSSLDFEYDLFLNGLVNCDNSGYRNRIRQYNETYDVNLYNDLPSLIESKSATTKLNNNNYRDEYRWPSQQPPPLIKSPQDSSSSSILFTSTTDSLFSALNSPLSRAATAYRHLQKPQRQYAIPNDYNVLPSIGHSNSNYINGKQSHLQSSQSNHSNSKTNQSLPISLSSSSTTTTTTSLSTTTTKNNNNIHNKIQMLNQNTTTTTTGNCNNIQHQNIQTGVGNSNGNNSIISNNTTQSSSLNSGKMIESQKILPPSSLAFSSSSSFSTSTGNQPSMMNNENVVDIMDNINTNLGHQHLHALHRFRQQRKKGLISRLKDVVISFTPKARCSLVNRVDDIYARYGKDEKDALEAFNFLNEINIEEEADNVMIDDDKNGYNVDDNKQEDVDQDGLMMVSSNITQSMTYNPHIINVNEPSLFSNDGDDDNLEMNLKMEEYDLIHPISSCDMITDLSNDNGDDDKDDSKKMTTHPSSSCEDDNVGNFKINIQNQKFNNNIHDMNDNESKTKSSPYSPIHNHRRHKSPPESICTPSSSSSSLLYHQNQSHTQQQHPYSSLLSSSPSKSNHSIKLQKFCRFGFPRKSSSLEFQSTMKRLDEEQQSDDQESISYHSHSVQETLQPSSSSSSTTTTTTGGKLLLLYCSGNENGSINHQSNNIGRYSFLTKNSSNPTSTNNGKKISKNRNNNKKSKNKMAFSTTSSSTTTTTTVTALSE
ncbi:hypothetical protein DERF_007732 [Dermatophagoides farinae]|uniref:Uncharacterized protein n=1 Tax=Dermatophagoides farinae TaxID=6954 RepID=A0A922L8D1_DERFA|nr:hypothetical protein DERF_007732 [Dermatophagoides farinae]